MDIFIPLHKACDYLRRNPQGKHIPVLCDVPIFKDKNETYLRVETAKFDQDFGLSIAQSDGMALAVPCFTHAERLDRDDTPANAEEYAKRGVDIAESLHFGSAMEYLAAWVNEDRKQADLCRDIDAVFSQGVLLSLPRWVQHDLFSLIEAEAMKQVFAKRFFDEDRREDMQPPAPVLLREAVRVSANHKTDKLISDLMTELMQKPVHYNGSARDFTVQADERVAIFRSLF